MIRRQALIDLRRQRREKEMQPIGETDFVGKIKLHDMLLDLSAGGRKTTTV